MNYSEILCQSMDTIAKNRMSQVECNKTLVCYISKVISDIKYEVTDGSIKFNAYSLGQSIYQIGDCVYILLINNDFNENKFILSKKYLE